MEYHMEGSLFSLTDPVSPIVSQDNIPMETHMDTESMVSSI